MAPAHTDGDTIIHFQKANVIHGGDVIFAGRYPFIDLSSGGSLPGVVAAVDKILALCDDRTRIIPGHGPVIGKADLTQYRDVLKLAHERVGALVKQGKSLDEVKAQKPMADYDAAWGTGFVKPDFFLELAYKSAAAK